MFREALQLHFEESLKEGDAIPEPASEAETITVDVEHLLAAA
jgi:predicted RNase H-like HicB family nuclease